MVSPISSNSYFNPYSFVNSIFPIGRASNQSSFSLPAFPSSYSSSSFLNNSGLYSSNLSSYASAQSNSLVGLSNQASALHSSASSLDLSQSTSVWYKRSVISTASDSVSGTAANGARIASYKVNVSQIAEGQQNTGTALNSSSVSSLSAGTYSFSVNDSDKLKNLSFSVTAGDSNLTVLNNLSNSINNANLGFTASVTKNTAAGSSQLSLKTNSTGAAHTFSLTDLSGTSIAVTGANTVTIHAADANYSVDGISHTSSSNNITLPEDSKVSLSFTKPETGAMVEVVKNTAAISKAIIDFTDKYNSTLSFLKQNQSYLSPQLSSSLKQAYNQNVYTLQKAGVTANTDGNLKVDTTKLTNSIKNDSSNLTSALSGTSGLARVSGIIADQITNSPASSYAKTSFYNPNQNGSGFSNQNSLYWQSVGSLFNQVY